MSTPAVSGVSVAAAHATPASAPATKASVSSSPAAAQVPAGRSAATALSSAVAEATESPSQTLKEAAGGDRQAQKLLHHGSVGTKINTKA